MSYPRLTMAKPRQPCTARLHAQCDPVRDAPALASVIIGWWQPLEDEWLWRARIADQVLPMLRQCQEHQQDMELMLRIGATRTPEIHILAVIDRTNA